MTLTTITALWLQVLLGAGQPLCTPVQVIDPPVAQTPFLQPLTPSSGMLHAQTTATVQVGDRLHTVTTQESFYVIGTHDPIPVRFEVYVDGAYWHGLIPRFDATPSPRPAWCSLPTGTPLHP